jgi:hypothetical protein
MNCNKKFTMNIIPSTCNGNCIKLLYNNLTYSLTQQGRGNVGFGNTALGKRASFKR